MNKKSLIILTFLLIVILSTLSVSANSYHLNKGDQLHISVWGHSDLQQKVTIGPDGTISFPLVGSVKSVDLTVNELKDKLQNKLSDYIKDPEVNVSLLQYRKPRVMVMGEVNNPGAYQIMENDTILDIISLAGGVTKIADMSNIKLRRNDKVEYYNLEQEDNQDQEFKTENTEVKSGDVIYVPGKLMEVTILGEVKKPGHYKIKKGARMSELLALAGGLSERASGKATFKKENTQKKINVNSLLKGESSENPTLNDGDEVFIPQTTKQVSILGQVNKPGSYKWHQELRLTELMARAGNYTEKGDIKEIKISNKKGKAKTVNLMNYLEEGNQKANPTLNPGDTVVIPELEKGLKVTILGEVKNPGHYPWEKGLQVADLLAQAGSKTDRANLKEIQLIHEDGNREMLNLDKFFNSDQKKANPSLQPGDIVVVNELETIDFKEFFAIVNGLNGLKNFLGLDW